ncbi:hypothetical protein J5N97_010117 [Dioscorea zingiberensis]|uniref:CCHC-type domain-containing protein n=1 Tax=Dioscorea zingiberensis TaxID=325984 RepID=A0A9D5CZK5_9LILI|nr:hypothetical protein J5N97_010117 [Dioscorea zingiberensis]
MNTLGSRGAISDQRWRVEEFLHNKLIEGHVTGLEASALSGCCWVGIQAPSRPGESATKTNSPRREGVSYADVVDRERPRSFIAETLTTPRSPRQRNSDEEEGWENVHFKRRRRSHGTPLEPRGPSPPKGPRQGSPPYIRTPAGLVEVCGYCLKPGYIAVECRRAITCRVCGDTGQKGRDCRWRSTQTRGKEEARPIPHHAPSEHRREPPRDEERGLNKQWEEEPEKYHYQQGKCEGEGRVSRSIEHHHATLEELQHNLQEKRGGGE